MNNMETLNNKRYENFSYICRYSTVPFYYDTIANKDVFGVGSNLYTNTAWLAHTVAQTDTLDYLALKYYNNPTLWWIIAYFNNIQDAFINLPAKFSVIKIPDMSSIEFGNERV